MQVQVQKRAGGNTGDGAQATVAGAGTTPRRRLRDLNVSFISLVGAAANRRSVIAKRAGAPAPTYEKVVRLVKADAARQMVYGVVYAPDECDTHGDTMSAAEIEKAAYDWMRKGRAESVDTEHDETSGHGYVAESWLVRKVDALFPGEPAGTWAVGIKVENAETWAAVAKGELTGLSLAGECVAEDCEDDTPVEKAGTTDTGVNMQQTTRKSVWQRVREAVGGPVGALDVEKGAYAHGIKARELREATWLLGDVFNAILGDEACEDKAAALREALDEFADHVDTLLGGATDDAEKRKKPRNVYRQPAETGEASVMASATVEKSQQPTDEEGDVNDYGAVVADLRKSVEALTARLTAVETATPGRQSAETREAVEKQGKDFKGFRFV